MKLRGFLMLLVSLAIAGLAAVWANRWMKGQLTGTGSQSQVAVAAIGIPFGTKLDATHVRMIEIHPNAVPEGAFPDSAKPIGRIAIQPIYKGEILIASRVVENFGGSALAAAVEPGMRAITVRVDDVVGVAGFLLPGNRVDVIATRRGGARGETDARTLIRNLKVLAVDQTTSPEKDKPVVVRAVTLEATPEEAEDLVRATQEGKVQLALRNPLEDVPDKSSQTAEAAPPATPAPSAGLSATAVATEPFVARVVTVEVMRRTKPECEIFGVNAVGGVVLEETLSDRCRPVRQASPHPRTRTAEPIPRAAP